MSMESLKLENKKDDVLIDEENQQLLCPECNEPVAELEALRSIDIPVPAFCPRCGHKLHY